MSPTSSKTVNGQGMTNEEVAEFIGVHYSTVSRLKNGDRMPSGGLLYDIMRVFRLDPEKTMNAFGQGPSVFAPYFRTHVLDKNVSDFPWLTSSEEPPTD